MFNNIKTNKILIFQYLEPVFHNLSKPSDYDFEQKHRKWTKIFPIFNGSKHP